MKPHTFENDEPQPNSTSDTAHDRWAEFEAIENGHVQLLAAEGALWACTNIRMPQYLSEESASALHEVAMAVSSETETLHKVLQDSVQRLRGGGPAMEEEVPDVGGRLLSKLHARVAIATAMLRSSKYLFELVEQMAPEVMSFDPEGGCHERLEHAYAWTEKLELSLCLGSAAFALV